MQSSAGRGAEVQVPGFIYTQHAVLLVLTAAVLQHCENETRGAERPNVVIILADDLGYGDVRAYNCDSKIPTPTLDRLAAEGLRFTDAHAPASCCTPTRYALLTGRYAWRSRLKSGVLRHWDPPLIEPGRPTIPSVLKQLGYVTACFGKWHLGLEWPTKDGKPASSAMDRLSNVDFSQPIGSGPNTRGFHYFFGLDTPHGPPYCFIENDRTWGIPSAADLGIANGFKIHGPMIANWKLVDILPELSRRVVGWIEQNANAGKPFFMYVPLTSPHFPVVPTAEFKGRSGAGDYGDFVCQTDWTIGEVLRALERTGAAGNTLVVVTSDNGPEITVENDVNPGMYDRIRQYRHYSAGPLRGAKRDLWEGGHRVPFLARWPGKIAAGTVTDALACHVDLLATLAAIVGKPLPADAAEDSFDLTPVLFGNNSASSVRDSLVYHSAGGKFAIRQADWVLIDDATGDDNLGRGGEPQWFKDERRYASHAQPRELFNLRDDLQQRHNLYADEPETADRMRTLLQRLKQDNRSIPLRQK